MRWKYEWRTLYGFPVRPRDDRALGMLRAIGGALDRDEAAERAAYAAFDRAFPGLAKPAAVKPNLRRRGWRRG